MSSDCRYWQILRDVSACVETLDGVHEEVSDQWQRNVPQDCGLNTSRDPANCLASN